jgi:Fur family peroxide stress response transcriptional regulator
MAIMAYLEGNTRHPSADDVYRAVVAKHPSISRATVYNTLDMLERRGDLHALTIDPDKKRFDPSAAAHHHLLCMQCGRIVDVHQSFKIPLQGPQRAGFTVLDNHIEFRGVCPACKKT